MSKKGPVSANILVEKYRQRKFRDIPRVWKALKREKLQTVIQSLEPKPEFVFDPYDHQLVTFLLVLKYPGIVVSLDMGTGKSKIMLDAFSYRRRLSSEEQQSKRMLVLVPNKTNVGAWEEQIRLHAPHLTYGLLSERVQSQERTEIWNDESLDVVVATYAGMVALHKRDGELKHKLVLRTGSLFDTIVADESSFFRNPESQSFKILGTLAHLVKFRYPMSGTPFTKDAQGLWTQFYFADPFDSPLTKVYGVFQSLFFTPMATAYGTKYILSQQKRDILFKVLKHLSIRYEESECNSIPTKRGGLADPICVPIQLHTQQSSFVQQTLQELREAARGGTEVAGAFNRLRRAASGYMEIQGTGEFRQFDDNPKLDACVDMLREMGSEQCVVVVYYKETVRLLEARLAEEQEKERKKRTGGISFKTSKVVGGSTGTEASMAAFKAGTSRILLLSTAGAYGLNLQFCRFMIIFESPIKPDDALQVEKRIHRTGQERHVTIYHLVAPIDAKILEGLRQDKIVLDFVMDGATDIV